MLIIESSLSNRRRDLGFKADLYARYGIPEYWVVDLDAAEVVVHVQPRAGGYQQIDSLGAGARVVPAMLDGVTIAVDDLLP